MSFLPLSSGRWGAGVTRIRGTRRDFPWFTGQRENYPPRIVCFRGRGTPGLHPGAFSAVSAGLVGLGMSTQDCVLGYFQPSPTGLNWESLALARLRMLRQGSRIRCCGACQPRTALLGYFQPVLSKLAVSIRRFGQHPLKTNQLSVRIGTSPEGVCVVARNRR